MPKVPFLKFYPADWIMDTRVLTDEEKAIWIDLLAFMWMNNEERGTVRGIWSDIARQIGRETVSVITSVKRLANLRVCDLEESIREGEQTVAKIISRRQVDDAKALDMNNLRQKRFNARNNGRTNAKITPKKTEDRRQIKNTPYSPPKGDSSPSADALKTKTNWGLFERLWEQYPSKDGKKAAMRHFQVTVKTEQDQYAIANALLNYLDSERVKKGFIKNGSTWFNNWRDWVNFKEKPNDKSSEYANRLLDRELREQNGTARLDQVPDMFRGVDETPAV